MTDIADIVARQILDSRGNPTVEVDVILAEVSFFAAETASSDLGVPVSQCELDWNEWSRWSWVIFGSDR